MSTGGDLPIACSLPLRRAAAQAGEWTELAERAISVEEVKGGLAVTYPAEIISEVENLVARESACCAWLDLSVDETPEGVRVTARSETAGSGPVIKALMGGAGNSPA